MRRANLIRPAVFCAVAVVHVLLLVFFVVRVESAVFSPAPPAEVMRLADIREAPPPPPPPEEPVVQTTSELVAQTVIEVEELPPAPEVSSYSPPSADNYLPMHMVSTHPVFDEAELRRALVYPRIARDSGREGLVYLELFIDRYGRVQRVDILRETPENYGFGEAAASIFRGRTCSPAMANGVPAAVRYRYPVRFRLR